MYPYLLIGCGGCLGAISRYAVSRMLQSHGEFPYATLIVNVIGSLLIGALAVWMLNRPGGAENLRFLLVVGFLGSFTTFSAFSLDTLNLMQSGAMSKALLNICANLVLCLFAVWLGSNLVR